MGVEWVRHWQSSCYKFELAVWKHVLSYGKSPFCCILPQFLPSKTCLAKIVQALHEYKKHLLFVNQWIQSEKQQVDLLLVSLKNLADLLVLQSKIQESITHQHKEAFIPDKPSISAWDKQLKIHVILRNFALFMENTVRAIRFMN
ncbi:interleukin-6-like [Heterodontus francisci]|uniref:interleukin-6-like n=1 Tax=Heterodontus francisci TaxID=7792 RepID=UPI00355AE51A